MTVNRSGILRRWVEAGAACLCLARSGVATAQSVHGQVYRTSDRTAVAAAVVSVIDSMGGTSARTITDERGRYSVVLAEGSKRLHVVRIGLRPADARLSAGEPHDTTIDVAMDLVPALLDTVRVALNTVCPESPDRRAAAELLDQARAGLLAAIVAREANPAQISTLTFQRRMDRRDQRVTQQRSQITSGNSHRPFVAARAGLDFVEQGFRAMRGTDELYFAPDADVMFDESFAATHCFRVQTDAAANRGEIGLAFEPTPARLRDTLVDVRGVLWLDPSAAKLTHMEFRFTGVNAAAENAGAGGSLHFQSMANGVVFIDEWTMSIPIVVVAGRTATLVGLSESGGVVVSAKWPDGSAWSPPSGRIRGQVIDRVAKSPIANAIVAMDGTVDSARTDSDGAFAFSPVIPGRYTLRVTDTTLSHFVKARSADREVVVSRGGTATIEFEGRSRASLQADLCKDQHPADGTATIFGAIADGSGEWPSKLTIESSWLADVGVGHFFDEAAKITNGKQVVDVDDGGNFKVCGVVRDRPVKMRVAVGRVPLADTAVTVDRDSVLRVVSWRLAANLFAEAQRGDGASVSGRVLRAGDGAPVADADVWTVVGDVHTRTDSAGRFHLLGLQRGPQLLQVRRIGFAAKRDTITVRAGEQSTREFRLESQVVELDTVRTKVGTVKYMSPALQGFEQRRITGQGHYISEAEMRKNDNGSVASIMRSRIPGIMMISYKGGDYATSTRGHAAILVDPNDSRSPRGCWVAVYIDGTAIYTGANDLPQADTGRKRTGEVATPAVSMFAPAPDMSRLPVSDFAGVEFYSDATLPIQFNAFRFTNCGSLFLWTRER